MFLVVRVKVWCMMRSLDLDEHPNDDSEESTEFRHTPFYSVTYEAATNDHR